MKALVGTLKVTASMANELLGYSDVGRDLAEADRCAAWASIGEQISAQGHGLTPATLTLEKVAIDEIIDWSMFEADMASIDEHENGLALARFIRTMKSLADRAHAAIANCKEVTR
jgi:hypothetical protein